jgi:hypothetical protein
VTVVNTVVNDVTLNYNSLCLTIDVTVLVNVIVDIGGGMYIIVKIIIDVPT